MNKFAFLIAMVVMTISSAIVFFSISRKENQVVDNLPLAASKNKWKIVQPANASTDSGQHIFSPEQGLPWQLQINTKQKLSLNMSLFGTIWQAKWNQKIVNGIIIIGQGKELQIPASQLNDSLVKKTLFRIFDNFVQEAGELKQIPIPQFPQIVVITDNPKLASSLISSQFINFYIEWSEKYPKEYPLILLHGDTMQVRFEPTLHDAMILQEFVNYCISIFQSVK